MLVARLARSGRLSIPQRYRLCGQMERKFLPSLFVAFAWRRQRCRRRCAQNNIQRVKYTLPPSENRSDEKYVSQWPGTGAGQRPVAVVRCLVDGTCRRAKGRLRSWCRRRLHEIMEFGYKVFPMAKKRWTLPNCVGQWLHR